ncbi:MAG: hypothetical protein ACPLRX_07635 [Candidatus Saccharicenans sp.]
MEVAKTIRQEREKQAGLPVTPGLLFLFVVMIGFWLSVQAGTIKENRKETATGGKNYAVLQNRKAVSQENQKAATRPTANDRAARVESGEVVRDKARLAILKENKFLEQELLLAKNPQYYFVINLKEKKIELRARGMVLKSWTARDIKYLGPAVPIEIVTLTQKTALKPPKRLLINPAENQNKSEAAARSEENKDKKKESEKAGATSGSNPSDNFELQALEITDMPSSYELVLSNGLEVAVRTLGKETARQRKELVSWYILRPVRNLFSGGKTEKPRLIIYFDKERDAQGIYWAFIDGLKGLIWLP